MINMRPRIIIVLQIAVASVAVCAPLHEPHELHDEQATNLDSENYRQRTNWLKTQNWLIDSINRLQREVNELSTSVTGHLDANDAESQSQQRAFVHDVAVLRADHTILAQQQQRIIQLIKERLDQTAAARNDQPAASNQVNFNAPTTNADQRPPSKHKRRPFVRELKKFEVDSKQNFTEVFAELKAQHDITLALFDDLRALEMRLAKQQLENSS